MNIALVFEIDGNPYFCDTTPNENQEGSTAFDLVSKTEIKSIESALRALGHSVERIDGPKALLERTPDLLASKALVFNKSRGVVGLERKAAVPVICDYHKIPYIGSSGYTATLARHKYHTNRLLAGMGFRVPFAFLVNCGQTVPADLNFSKCIVKPNHEAGALGINEDSIVEGHHDLCEAVARIHHRFNQPAIIEDYISGEEFKVAVIGNTEEAAALGCVAVMADGRPLTDTLQTRKDVLFDRLAYYTPKASALVDAALDTALQIHLAFECRDYSRIDFRVSEEKSRLVCMEVSTQPDLGRNASFVSAATQTVKSYKTGIQAILAAACRRYRFDAGACGIADGIGQEGGRNDRRI